MSPGALRRGALPARLLRVDGATWTNLADTGAVRRYADGAWTDLLQLEFPVHVAGSPGGVVITGPTEAWRGPLASW